VILSRLCLSEPDPRTSVLRAWCRRKPASALPDHARVSRFVA